MSSHLACITQTFRELETSANEWTPCEIVDFDLYQNDKGVDYEVPVWGTPVGYDFAKTRFSNPETCHLCGHNPIMEICHIKHDGKKLVMIVGNRCVDTYILGAGETITQLISRKREDFRYNILYKKYTSLADGLKRARKGHVKIRKRMPLWLFDALKIVDKQDAKATLTTSRRLSNFIRKYEPILQDAIIRRNATK
jgi:hypothetical protein